jgi:hypothetical protein
MTFQIVNPVRSIFQSRRLSMRKFLTGALLLTACFSGSAMAQEVEYSWLDLTYINHNVDRQGSQTPIVGQTVDVAASDGNGVRFRGSFGTWKNLYGFIDYASSNIGVAAVITNSQCPPGNTLDLCRATDEFDLTTVRGGIGVKYSIAFSTDIYAEISYDSLDFDFGSFAGDNFDTRDKDIGGAIGVRSMLSDDIEVRAYARHSNHSDVNLSAVTFDPGQFYGAGFGWQFIRGLSVVADYESGDFDSWSIGFRLDLGED